MNSIYIVSIHADGYQVIKQGASRGISTHADILNAIEECRVANRFVRSMFDTTITEENVNEILINA